MSYKLVDQIIRKSRAASGSVKAVLIAMATYAEDDGTNIFPAMNNLADDAGVGERTAYRAVDELLELGLINDVSFRQGCVTAARPPCYVH
jgi:DNA-binding transcriptional regulator YhcF (GntR family)